MNLLKDLSAVKTFIGAYPIVLLVVKTPQCSVCDAILEQLKPLLDQYPQVKGAVVSIEDTPSVVSEFLVLTAPTILLFVEGKEVLRESRFVRFAKMNEALTAWTAYVFSTEETDR